VVEEKIRPWRWLRRIERFSCKNMEGMGRKVIPTLDGGGVREAADGLLGFLHGALAAVHDFCLDNLELGGRTKEMRRCEWKL
jgi:hypothetical protein